ncbi:MAG: riboflavin synthase [Anaerolineae bacterium]
MFSGIVEEVGKVASIRRRGEIVEVTIAASQVLGGTELGDSLAINGTCLTVTRLTDSSFTVELSPETLRRTNLGDLQPGAGVNLERSLAVGGRIGGHFVQGHIDGTGQVQSLTPEGESIMVRFTAPPSLMRYVVPKGYIAIDGMSLTIVERDADSFTVAFIPYTLAHTIAGSYNAGDRVNLEADIIGKYVENILAYRQEALNSNISREFLEEHGFWK